MYQTIAKLSKYCKTVFLSPVYIEKVSASTLRRVSSYIFGKKKNFTLSAAIELGP